MKKAMIVFAVLLMVFAAVSCREQGPDNSSSSLAESSIEESSMDQSGVSKTSSSSTSDMSEEDIEFYSQPTINVTWLNVWDGSSESWWSPASSSGTKVLYPGIDTQTSSLNWNDSTNILRKYYMDQVREAGIDAVVLDLTNGISWGSACNYIAMYCDVCGMKFCAAIYGDSAVSFEQKARQIWNSYASETAAYKDAYLYKDGKPVLVAYAGQNIWDNAINGKLMEYGSKFTVVWSSGENSRINKWGWQAPAKDGPVTSKDSMFITPSINWTAPEWSITGWRRSLAYLDYGFLLARRSHPKYLIVSSYDDMRERNGWAVADTANASFNYRVLVRDTPDTEGTPGLQMRNVLGQVSSDAFYNRVKEWLTKGTASPFYPGGMIADGAYLMTNAFSGKGLTSENPKAYNPQDGQLPIDFSYDRVNVPVTQQQNPGYQQYMFFYHLGGNEYRIIRLCVGLSLEDKDGTVVVNRDSESARQRWIIAKAGSYFTFTNKGSGKMLCVTSRTSDAVTAAGNTGDLKQQWSLEEIAVME